MSLLMTNIVMSGSRWNSALHFVKKKERKRIAIHSTGVNARA